MLRFRSQQPGPKKQTRYMVTKGHEAYQHVFSHASVGRRWNTSASTATRNPKASALTLFPQVKCTCTHDKILVKNLAAHFSSSPCGKNRKHGNLQLRYPCSILCFPLFLGAVDTSLHGAIFYSEDHSFIVSCYNWASNTGTYGYRYL